MPALRNKIRVREKRKSPGKSKVASRLREGHRPESRRNSFAVLVFLRLPSPFSLSLSSRIERHCEVEGEKPEKAESSSETRLGSRRIYLGSRGEEALGRRPRISIARKEKRRRRREERGRTEAPFALGAVCREKRLSRLRWRSRIDVRSCHDVLSKRGHKVSLLLSLDSFALENLHLRRRKHFYTARVLRVCIIYATRVNSRIKKVEYKNSRLGFYFLAKRRK